MASAQKTAALKRVSSLVIELDAMQARIVQIKNMAGTTNDAKDKLDELTTALEAAQTKASEAVTIQALD